jgi:predicted Zn-dependent peptidase
VGARGTARAGQGLDEVEGLLRGALAKLEAGAFDHADLDAIVLRSEMDEMRARESNRARVARMAFSFVMREPWQTEVAELGRLRAVTRGDELDLAGAL